MASPLSLTVLGCHSASPKANAHPTSQVLELRGHIFLIDCGEGTQVRLRKSNVKFSRIKHIFISHLHGDHVFGLIGLISTFGMMNRTESLTVYGPKGIKELILFQLKLSQSFTTYPLYFVELDSNEPELIFEDDKVRVETIPLCHRIYTNGFLFQEKNPPRKLNVPKLEELQVDKVYYGKLQRGLDIQHNGNLLTSDEVSFVETPKSFAFCSDTAYLPEIIPQIKDVFLLYHEATFLETEKELCEKTKHSTALQAALIAKQAKAQHLLLGHFSARYKNLELFVDEAKQFFENVQAAETLKRYYFL